MNLLERSFGFGSKSRNEGVLFDGSAADVSWNEEVTDMRGY